MQSPPIEHSIGNCGGHGFGDGWDGDNGVGAREITQYVGHVPASVSAEFANVGQMRFYCGQICHSFGGPDSISVCLNLPKFGRIQARFGRIGSSLVLAGFGKSAPDSTAVGASELTSANAVPPPWMAMHAMSFNGIWSAAKANNPKYPEARGSPGRDVAMLFVWPHARSSDVIPTCSCAHARVPQEDPRT